MHERSLVPIIVEDLQSKMELRFIRDTDLREIDFVVLRDKKPLFAVECKTGEKKIAAYQILSRTYGYPPVLPDTPG